MTSHDFSHDTTLRFTPQRSYNVMYRNDSRGGTRTPDPLINSQEPTRPPAASFHNSAVCSSPLRGRSRPEAAQNSPTSPTTGPSLFDFPQTPPSVAVDTSEDAAQAVKCIASKLRRQVFATLLASGGLTCDELCQRFNRGGNTMRPRLRELEDQGLIVKSAERRPTHTGSPAVVYQVTDKGCRAYREAA